MSYILDALHKSEQARQRGRVPDLNTLAADARPSPDARPRSPATAAMATLLVAGGLAVLGWWRPWQTAPAMAPLLRESATTAQPSPATPLPPAPMEETARNVLPPTVANVSAGSAEDATPASLPAPAQPQTSAPLKRIERLSTRISEPAARPASAPADPPPTRAPTRRILAINELPPAVRAALPRLDVSGYAYAGDSGRRMVVVNDRLVHEGDEAAAGVTLRSAAQDGVVFEFQGHRFRGQP